MMSRETRWLPDKSDIWRGPMLDTEHRFQLLADQFAALEKRPLPLWNYRNPCMVLITRTL